MIFFSFINDYFVQFTFCMLSGYLFGSLNFSIIFTKIFSKSDIRNMGSHNAGFTNVLRCVGVLPSILTFVCDLVKCIIAICIATALFRAYTYNGLQNETVVMICKYITGITCILGHMYPCFFKFKGGKGVVTTVATVAVIDYRIALLILAVFIIVLFITKIVSLSSIIAGMTLPIFTFVINYFFSAFNSQDNLTYALISTVMSLIISIIVVLKHKPNIQRLKHGQEKKISVKK